MTRYTLLQAGKGDEVEAAMAARVAFWERYDAPLLSYLHGVAKGDHDLAEEAHGDLKLKFLSGRMVGYSQDRGLFRDFLKSCARNLKSDLQRKRQRITLHEEAMDPTTLDEARPGLHAQADPAYDEMAVTRELDLALGWEFEHKALDQFRLLDRQGLVPKGYLQFFLETKRIECAAEARGINLSGEQFAGLVSKAMGLAPALTHTAFRSKKSRVERVFWSLFLDEVYDSAVLREAPLEAIRESVCEMGYWERVGRETWEAWAQEVAEAKR